MTTLKQLRQKAGLTRLEVAKALGLTSGQYIYNVEKGKCRLAYKHFRAIAKLYGVNVERLIKDRVRQFEKELRERV